VVAKSSRHRANSVSACDRLGQHQSRGGMFSPRRTASVEMWQVPSVATRKMYVDPAAGVEVCGGAPR
jgi:hypothetical protein